MSPLTQEMIFSLDSDEITKKDHDKILGLIKKRWMKFYVSFALGMRGVM
jgi:hypothetical protein